MISGFVRQFRQVNPIMVSIASRLMELPKAGKLKICFKYRISKEQQLQASDLNTVYSIFFTWTEKGGLISVRDRLFMIGGRTLSIEESVEGKWKHASRNMTAILNSFEVLSFDSNPYLFG